MSMKDDNILPVLYRCDRKYKFFLLNSIKSLLKYYTGKKRIITCICTNDDITLDELDPLKLEYNFEYQIIRIDKEFIESRKISGMFAKLALRKFYGFTSYDAESVKYNDTTYQFNPYNRSKTIIWLWLFFIITSAPIYEKIICLDTDTIIVSCIDELYETNVTDVPIATCYDWIETDTINPSVAVVNTKKFKNAILKKGTGVIINLLAKDLPRHMPFCEAMQKAVSDIFINDCIILDRSWNSPVTHQENCDKPKIYHFSESWVGNEKVLETYDVIVNKYLQDV